eukprot:902533-Rhodomonas_salina.1
MLDAALIDEEQRLKSAAESLPANSQAMAAYSRFLRVKMKDEAGANKWHRLAVNNLSSKMSQSVTGMVSYYL